jgi:FKBP-type peptidyl-prolyl cis-trans isomerase FkpA
LFIVFTFRSEEHMFSSKLLKTLSISAVVGLAANANAQTTTAPTAPAAGPVPAPLTAGKAAQMPTPPAPGSASVPMPPVGGAGVSSPTPLPAGTPAPLPAPLKAGKGGAELKPLNAAKADAKAATKVETKAETFPATVNELISRDRTIGTGDAVASGQAVAVQYTGWIYDPSKPDGKGAKFDSSRDRPPAPFSFMLGAGRVIKGWDQGVVGMKQTGQRTLIIPPQMAYGERSVGPIAANSTLIFDIELIGILSPAPGKAAPAAVEPSATPAPASK